MAAGTPERDGGIARGDSFESWKPHLKKYEKSRALQLILARFVSDWQDSAEPYLATAAKPLAEEASPLVIEIGPMVTRESVARAIQAWTATPYGDRERAVLHEGEAGRAESVERMKELFELDAVRTAGYLSRLERLGQGWRAGTSADRTTPAHAITREEVAQRVQKIFEADSKDASARVELLVACKNFLAWQACLSVFDSLNSPSEAEESVDQVFRENTHEKARAILKERKDAWLREDWTRQLTAFRMADDLVRLAGKCEGNGLAEAVRASMYAPPNAAIRGEYSKKSFSELDAILEKYSRDATRSRIAHRIEALWGDMSRVDRPKREEALVKDLEGISRERADPAGTFMRKAFDVVFRRKRMERA